MSLHSLNLEMDYEESKSDSSYISLGPDAFGKDEEETDDKEPGLTTTLTEETEIFFSDEKEVSKPQNEVLEIVLDEDDIMKNDETDIILAEKEKSETNPNNYEPEVIRIPEEETSIEGLPFSRENKGRPVKAKEEKELLYGTEKVAQILGTTTQTIRNYCDDYDFYLNIEKTNAGARRFRYEDIEKLRYILKTKDEKQLTKEEMQMFLKDSEYFKKQKPYSDKEAMQVIVEEIMDKMTKQFSTNMEIMMKNTMEMSQKMLEDKNSQSQVLMDKLNERLEKQEKTLEELVDKLKNSSVESEAKEMQHADQIDNLMKMIKEKEKEVEQLQKEANDKDLQIKELQNNIKPKKFFRLFG